MSRICPVRAASSASSRDPSPTTVRPEPLGVERVQVEDLVLDAGDGAAVRRQVPAAYDAVGRDRGRPVERLRGRCPPVQQQLPVLVVGQPDPADVAVLAVAQVQPPEAQPVLDGAQLAQPAAVQRGERVALGAGRGGAGAGRAAYPLQRLPGPGPELVESPVERVEVALLGVELLLARVGRGHRLRARRRRGGRRGSTRSREIAASSGSARPARPRPGGGLGSSSRGSSSARRAASRPRRRRRPGRRRPGPAPASRRRARRCTAPRTTSVLTSWASSRDSGSERDRQGQHAVRRPSGRRRSSAGRAPYGGGA